MNCCHPEQLLGSALPEHAGGSLKVWVLSCSEKVLAFCGPEPSTLPYSEIVELTLVNDPVA
jgi:hypothetical protein